MSEINLIFSRWAYNVGQITIGRLNDRLVRRINFSHRHNEAFKSICLLFFIFVVNIHRIFEITCPS